MLKGMLTASFCPAVSLYLTRHNHSMAYCGVEPHGWGYLIFTFFVIWIGTDFWEFLYHWLGHKTTIGWHNHKHHHLFFNPSSFAVIAGRRAWRRCDCCVVPPPPSPLPPPSSPLPPPSSLLPPPPLPLPLDYVLLTLMMSVIVCSCLLFAWLMLARFKQRSALRQTSPSTRCVDEPARGVAAYCVFVFVCACVCAGLFGAATESALPLNPYPLRSRTEGKGKMHAKCHSIPPPRTCVTLCCVAHPHVAPLHPVCALPAPGPASYGHAHQHGPPLRNIRHLLLWCVLFT